MIMITNIILVALIIYVLWIGYRVLNKIDKVSDNIPDHGSYDDLLKRRRGRSKY